MTAPKLVFIGFMGAGKSSAAASAAELLGERHADSDAEIEARGGRPITAIFSEDGEQSFRALEERVVLELLDGPAASVVSLGGGALGSSAVRAALSAHRVVWLDIDPETAWRRASDGTRPLARDPDAFHALHAAREPIYAEAADAILPGEQLPGVNQLQLIRNLPEDARMIWARSDGGDYPALIGPGLLGDPVWQQIVDGRRFLVTDGQVGRLYGEHIGAVAGRVAIMPGEQSKTVAHAEIVWTELARAGMTRSDVVLALGGGVVGDLAGFCAATYQRGVPVIQIPTTLVAQVDSAYGGKTGVDLPEAKNYVGAFHQPSAVVADTDALASLPPAEMAAGYAEVVKTALIAGGELWERVRAGAEPDDPDVIWGCALTKLRIVARDERDGGLRQVLNLGHTVGHAIETVTGYARYRHGEAVALGLLAALRLSGREDLRQEVGELLAGRGLPLQLDPSIDPADVVMATARDKKRLGEGQVPFVLLPEAGRPEPGQPVSPRELVSAVRELAP